MTQPTGVWCQKPSFTPDITALLDMANIPEELVPHVTSETAWAVGFPLEQPDLPGVLLFTIIATLLSAILVIPTSLSRTLPPYSAVRVRMQQIAYWPTAVGVGWTVLVLVFAITGESGRLYLKPIFAQYTDYHKHSRGML